MKKLLISLCLIAFSISAFAAPAKKLSLKEAKALALQYNTDVQNAKLDVDIAKKKIWETTAIGLPQISATVDYQNFPNIPVTLIPAIFFDEDAKEGEFAELKFGTQHNANLTLTVNQLIFKGGYIVGLQASRIFLQLSKDKLKKSEIEIKETVTNTYHLILLAEESERIVKSSVANIKKTYGETKELLNSGFIEDTDLKQIQLSLSELENSLASISRQKAVTYRLLKFQIGLDLDLEIELSDSLSSMVSDINRATLIGSEFNAMNYIDYKMLDTQEKSLKLVLKNEISEYLPTISAFFQQKESAMREEFNFFRKNDDKWFSSTVIGLNINIPIFDSGMKGARIGQAKLELKKARNAKANAKKGLMVEWKKNTAQFEDEFDKLQRSKENVKLAKKIYENLHVKYKNGLATSMELIQSHNQYLNSESSYIQTMIALLNAKTKIDKLINKL